MSMFSDGARRADSIRGQRQRRAEQRRPRRRRWTPLSPRQSDRTRTTCTDDGLEKRSANLDPEMAQIATRKTKPSCSSISLALSASGDTNCGPMLDIGFRHVPLKTSSHSMSAQARQRGDPA